MRKVIQAFPFLGAIHALCDDGTLWALEGGQWNKLVPIPQDMPPVVRRGACTIVEAMEKIGSPSERGF